MTNVVEKIDTQAHKLRAPLRWTGTTTAEDQAITFDVVANDSDGDGDPRIVTSINTSGTVGSVVINADGTLSYTPVADFNGVDSFTYRVSDPAECGRGGRDRHGHGLVMMDDAAATDEDTAVSIPVSDLLLNDSSQQRRSRLGGGFGRRAVGAVVSLQVDGTVSGPSTASSSAFGCRRLSWSIRLAIC